MVSVYMLNLSESFNSQICQILYKNVSQERKNRINKFKIDLDKKRCLFSEMLLRFALEYEYDIFYDDLEISYNTYGKPFFINTEKVFFNISHSGSWVVCAIGNYNMGIDVEIMDDYRYDISKRVFTERELLYFNENKQSKNEIFYRLWTLKESFSKALGVGMSIPFNSFEFLDIFREPKVLSQEVNTQNYMFNTVKADNNHIVSLCIEKPFSNDYIDILYKNVSITQISKSFV